MTRDRAACGVAALASVLLGLVAWNWRTGAVGGSDSACYALMAKAYADGQWQPESPLALVAPWPEPTRVAAPGGFLPSATRRGGAVPVCAPGYGLVLAPLVWIGGGQAVHVVPPIAAAILAWTSFLLARRLAGPWAGAAAALLVACHPLVLFQAVQPMNDITTAAIWTAVAWAALTPRPAVAGLLIGLGLLVRPNLAPAAAAAVLACGAIGAGPLDAGWWRRAMRTAALAAVAATPGVAVALGLNASLYGSPFQTGYGDLGTLFSLAHVPENLRRYAGTWLATSTPVVLVAVLAPWLVPPASRRLAWALVALGAALSIVYLAYRPFPEWWYLRFLLPAVVWSLVLASSAVVAPASHRGGRIAWASAGAIIIGIAVWTARGAHAQEAFTLHRLESRFALAAEVATRLPSNAVIITVWESGAMRFGSGHEVVMWDALDPQWLDRAIAWLQHHGRSPVLMLESWEAESFRRRFDGQTYGALDWPPRFDVDRRVFVYVPHDRDVYRRGGDVATERVFMPRARR